MALTPTQEAQVLQLVAEQAALLSLADNEATIISKLGATKVNLSSLGSAVTFDDADIMLIRQGTTDLSISGSVVKAAVGVPDASETVKGKVELATSAETITGTDNARAVHPAGLASLTATESRAGLIEIATNAEAQAFTALKAIDGAKLSTAFKGANQSLLTNGFQKLPGGLILQWVSGTPAGGSETYTFPIAFPNAVFCVATAAKTTAAAAVLVDTLSLTQAGIKTFTTTTGTLFSVPFSIFVIGY